MMIRGDSAMSGARAKVNYKPLICRPDWNLDRARQRLLLHRNKKRLTPWFQVLSSPLCSAAFDGFTGLSEPIRADCVTAGFRERKIMYNATEQFSELNKANYQQALRLASLGLENAEKLAKLSVEHARLAIEDGMKTAEAAAAVKDFQDLMTLRARIAAIPNSGCAMDHQTPAIESASTTRPTNRLSASMSTSTARNVAFAARPRVAETSACASCRSA